MERRKRHVGCHIPEGETMISKDEFFEATDQHWNMEQQLTFLAENTDWLDRFFDMIHREWESVQDTMEWSCILAFARKNGLEVNLPTDDV